MGKSFGFLTVLLLLQVALVGWLNYDRNELTAYSADKKLLPLEVGSFDRVVIEEPEKDPLTLQQMDAGWILPDAYDAPVSKKKIKNLTEDLLAVTRPWPVGKSDIAAKQFKVTDTGYEKKLTFYKGDSVLKTLFVGSSPAFRKVHMRLDGTKETYAVEYNTFNLQVQSNAWLDRSILNVSQDNITKLTIGEIVLSDVEGALTLNDLKSNEEMETKELTTLIEKVTSVSFSDVLGVEDKPEYRQSKPEVSFSVELRDGNTHTYTFSGPLGDDNYVVKASHHPQYFKVNESVFKAIKDVTRASLVQEKKVEEKKEAAAPADTEAEPTTEIVTEE